MKIVVATHNAGKLKEIQEILQLPDLELVTLDQVGLADLEIPETGQTFAENAELKAVAVAEKTGLPTIADDSGLSIDCLNGQPGVYSARFAPGSDGDRCQKVLSLLDNEKNRTAKFVCTVCFVNADKKEFFTGEVVGTIGFSLRGEQGFGYDPIFIPNGYQQTFGELGKDIKNTLSHRAEALLQLKRFLHAR